MFELWRLKHKTKSVSLTDSEVQTFLESEENLYTKKVTYSVALVLAFLSAENKNRQLEDLLLVQFWLFTRETSVAKDKSMNENFVH